MFVTITIENDQTQTTQIIDIEVNNIDDIQKEIFNKIREIDYTKIKGVKDTTTSS